LVATLARRNKLAFRNCSSCPPNLAELFRWPTGRSPVFSPKRRKEPLASRAQQTVPTKTIAPR
jgi:hypothetical protein